MEVAIDSYCYHRFPSHDADYLRSVRVRLDQYQLDRIYAWGHPDGLEGGRNERVFTDMIASFEHARAIGAGVMRVVGSLVRMFREAVKVTEEYGIRMAVENHIDFTADEMLRLLTEVGSPWLGINFDTGNFLRLLDDPVKGMAKLAKYVYAAHIKDLLPQKGVSADEWFFFSSVPVGDGLVDHGALVRLLAEVGYTGSLAVEMDFLHPDYTNDEDGAVAKSVAELKRLVAGVQMKRLNIATIGAKFMGRAHSHAWLTAPQFFDLDAQPVLKVICDLYEPPVKDFAARWGWEEYDTSWERVVARDDIDVVDIAVPTYLHHPIAVAAARAGKHVFCEKPIALNAAQARDMAETAEAAGVTHYLNHNYRRCPAVALARQLIGEGKIGRIHHWRGAYLQSWIMDPEFPLTWQLRRETAGSGPHADLNSHSVDLARHLVDDITEVQAMRAGVIRERPPADASSGAFDAGASAAGRGTVTVENAAFLTARFENGALGSFEASRFALGRKSFNCFEIYGSEGNLSFNLERMNELDYFAAADTAHAQGFRTILATEALHPYVGHWWPPGHIIGYEHTFMHAVAGFVRAVVRREPATPNFHDGVRNLLVLDAGLESARTGSRVAIPGAGEVSCTTSSS